MNQYQQYCISIKLEYLMKKKKKNLPRKKVPRFFPPICYMDFLLNVSVKAILSHIILSNYLRLDKVTMDVMQWFS